MSSGVFHQLYYHFVWATRERLPLPDNNMNIWLRDEITRNARKREAEVLACYVMPDHVHLLVRLPPNDIATFIGQVKGASAFAFNREFGVRHLLKWQDGYGVLTLRAKDTAKVVHYIENQEQIHALRRSSALMENVNETDISDKSEEI